MISNFKLFPNFNISQNFVQNVQKQKKHLCPELLLVVRVKHCLGFVFTKIYRLRSKVKTEDYLPWN